MEEIKAEATPVLAQPINSDLVYKFQVLEDLQGIIEELEAFIEPLDAHFGPEGLRMATFLRTACRAYHRRIQPLEDAVYAENAKKSQ